jgi:hypothetical protein
MKKKLIFLVIGILVLGAASSGYIYSFFMIAKLEKTVQKPIPIGFATFYPGNQIGKKLGYFTSAITLEDSKIEFGENKITIPVMDITISGTKAIMKSAFAEGTLNQLQKANLEIKSIQIETDADKISQLSTEIEAKFLAEQINIKNGDNAIKLNDFKLNGNRIDHNFWDNMELRIKQANYDNRELSLVISDFHLSQDQHSEKTGRLDTKTVFKMNGLKAKEMDNKKEYNIGNLLFDVRATINGDNNTIAFKTLYDLFSQNGSIDRYIFKYNPKLHFLKFDSKNLDFVGSRNKFACDNLLIETEGATKKDVYTNNSELKILNFGFFDKQGNLEFDKFSFQNNMKFYPKFYEKFLKVIEEHNRFSNSEVIDSLYGFTKTIDFQNRFMVSNLSFYLNKKEDSLKLSEGSIETDFSFDDGVGNISFRPIIALSNLKALQETVQIKIPVENLKQQLNIKIKSVDLRAFEGLLKNIENPDTEARVDLANQAIKNFIKAKPEASIQFEVSTQDGPSIDLMVSYGLNGELPKDFTVAPVFYGKEVHDNELRKALIDTSVLRINLLIKEQEKLISILNRMQGQGFGEALLEQFNEYFVVEDKNMRTELMLQGDKLSVNGSANPSLQEVFDLLVKSPKKKAELEELYDLDSVIKNFATAQEAFYVDNQRYANNEELAKEYPFLFEPNKFTLFTTAFSEGERYYIVAFSKKGPEVFEFLSSSRKISNDPDLMLINSIFFVSNKIVIDSLVAKLLATGVDVNRKDSGGWTALMCAAYQGHVSICKKLVQRGSDINARDKNGETALFKAAYTGKVAVVAELLKLGANPGTKNNDGMTALAVALKNGHTEVETLLERSVIPKDWHDICTKGVVEYLLSQGIKQMTIESTCRVVFSDVTKRKMDKFKAFRSRFSPLSVFNKNITDEVIEEAIAKMTKGEKGAGTPNSTQIQISCSDLKSDNPKYHEKMDELAERAGLPDNYWNRYHESVVYSLCRGEIEVVDGMVDDGYVKPQEVQDIAKVIGKTYESKQRSEMGKRYEYSRKKFSEMGACNACAANIAVFYTEKPNSKCGRLAKQAIEGDPGAIERLVAFPDYCQPN